MHGSPALPPVPGPGGAQQAFGPYVLEAPLGRGGVGTVYRARHTALGHAVALKLLHGGAGATATQRERLLREARAAARIRHPGVVTVRDVGEERGLVYVVMDLVAGESAEERLRRGPLPPREAADVARQVARALDAAHGAGFLHRDVKPANILLAPDGRALLTDFGVAKVLDAASLTASGAAVGTPWYAAPEQLLGGAVDARADVYALGGTLHALLTGEPPFAAASLVELVAAAAGATPAPPSRARPEVPAAVDAVVLRCLAKRPEDRFPDARAVAEALDRALARPRRRRRAGPALAAALALVGVGATAFVAGAALRGPPPPAGPAQAAPTPGAPTPGAPTTGAPPPPAPALPPPAPAPPPPAPAPPPPAPAPDGRAAAREVSLAVRARAAAGALSTPEAIAAAIAELTRALTLAPDEPEVLVDRGVLRGRAGDLRGAEADYTRAIEVAPTFAVAWFDRATLRQRAGDLPGSRGDFDALLRLAPGDPTALAGRGETRRRQGDLAGALADLDAALAATPVNALARCNRALARIQAADLAGARADYDQAIADDPRSAPAHDGRACLRARTGDDAGAAEDLDEALRLDPGHVSALRNRALLRARRGEGAAAVADAERACALAPGDPFGEFVRGRALLAAGRREEAARAFDRFLARAPGDPAAAEARAARAACGAP